MTETNLYNIFIETQIINFTYMSISTFSLSQMPISNINKFAETTTLAILLSSHLVFEFGHIYI